MIQGALEAQIAGKVCVSCDSDPRVVWGGSWGINAMLLRCNCPFVDGRPAEPKLAKAEHPVARRWRDMTTQDLARQEERGEKVIQYDTERGTVSLSTRVVQELFCKNANSMESYAFIQLCRFHQLNPFLREVYLVKYDRNAAAQIIIGKQAYTSRASQDINFDGMEEGIVVSTSEGEQEIAGTIIPKEATLIGGWCRVYRKDRRVDTYKRLSLAEYDKKQSVWKDKPATMINKCAIVAALRDAFPSMFSTLNEIADRIEEPIDARAVDVDTGEILEGEVIESVATDAPEDAPGAPEEEAHPPSGDDLFPEAEVPAEPVTGLVFKNLSALWKAVQENFGTRYKGLDEVAQQLGLEDRKAIDFPTNPDVWNTLVYLNAEPDAGEEVERQATLS